MIDRTGGGRDADVRRAVSWPAPQWEVLDDTVPDRLTRLVWTRNADMAEFPPAWQEALDYIATMKRGTVFDFPARRLGAMSSVKSDNDDYCTLFPYYASCIVHPLCLDRHGRGRR